MKLHPLWALALAALPALPACTDDDSGDPDDVVVTWRVPCAAHGHWSDGLVFTSVYTYDARKHLTESMMTNSTGEVIRHATLGWTVDRVQWVEVVGTQSYRTDYGYDEAGRTTLITRVDRALANGDQGYVLRYGYDDSGAMITADIDYTSAELRDLHSTITGDLSARSTSVDCTVDDQPEVCDAWIWDQPDGDRQHWTRGTVDYGTKGAIDTRYDRTLDDHGLELTYVETSFVDVPAGAMQTRITVAREPDGTELRHTNEAFSFDGQPSDTYQHENEFTCAAARSAAPSIARGAVRDGAEDADARLPRWRAALR